MESAVAELKMRKRWTLTEEVAEKAFFLRKWHLDWILEKSFGFSLSSLEIFAVLPVQFSSSLSSCYCLSSLFSIISKYQIIHWTIFVYVFIMFIHMHIYTSFLLILNMIGKPIHLLRIAHINLLIQWCPTI